MLADFGAGRRIEVDGPCRDQEEQWNLPPVHTGIVAHQKAAAIRNFRMAGNSAITVNDWVAQLRLGLIVVESLATNSRMMLRVMHRSKMFMNPAIKKIEVIVAELEF